MRRRPHVHVHVTTPAPEPSVPVAALAAVLGCPATPAHAFAAVLRLRDERTSGLRPPSAVALERIAAHLGMTHEHPDRVAEAVIRRLGTAG